MVLKSVGTVISVKRKWHADFHHLESGCFIEVGEEGGGGWMGREWEVRWGFSGQAMHSCWGQDNYNSLQTFRPAQSNMLDKMKNIWKWAGQGRAGLGWVGPGLAWLGSVGPSKAGQGWAVCKNGSLRHSAVLKVILFWWQGWAGLGWAWPGLAR